MNKSKKTIIHRGELLKAIVKRSDLNISQITRKAGYSRASYYLHINRGDLPFEILEVYGKALSYDFSEELPEMIKYVSYLEPAQEYLNPQQAIREKDRWRNKYFELLEKYNLLIEEKLLLNKNKKA